MRVEGLRVTDRDVHVMEPPDLASQVTSMGADRPSSSDARHGER